MVTLSGSNTNSEQLSKMSKEMYYYCTLLKRKQRPVLVDCNSTNI